MKNNTDDLPNFDVSIGAAIHVRYSRGHRAPSVNGSCWVGG